jgi:CubicO group peptidase (beta-lactamase class C family)
MSKRRRPCPLPLVLALATALPALPALGASPEDAAFAEETREYLGRLERLGFAEDGRLRVEDPITAHFEGVPEDKRAITLHQLLTHSSGVVDLEGYGDWDPIGREELVERILAQPLAFEPGTGYQYSNAGYSLLGAIIERLTGGSYERFVRERFFVPLGMYETGYVQAGWGAGRLAQGYRGEEPWGTVLDRPMAEDGPYWVLRANGGIHTTAYDMLRWAGRCSRAESSRPPRWRASGRPTSARARAPTAPTATAGW